MLEMFGYHIEFKYKEIIYFEGKNSYYLELTLNMILQKNYSMRFNILFFLSIYPI